MQSPSLQWRTQSYRKSHLDPWMGKACAVLLWLPGQCHASTWRSLRKPPAEKMIWGRGRLAMTFKYLRERWSSTGKGGCMWEWKNVLWLCVRVKSGNLSLINQSVPSICFTDSPSFSGCCCKTIGEKSPASTFCETHTYDMQVEIFDQEVGTIAHTHARVRLWAHTVLGASTSQAVFLSHCV